MLSFYSGNFLDSFSWTKHLKEGQLSSKFIIKFQASPLQLIMHFKIVVDNQIRIFDCKETLTLEALNAYVRKAFPKLRSFSFYYIDQEGDHIILETKQDVSVYLETYQKMPRIYVKKVQSEIEVFDSTSQITEPIVLEDNGIISQEKKAQIKEMVNESFEQINTKTQQKQKRVKEEQPEKEEPLEQKQEKERNVTQMKDNSQKPSSLIHKVRCDYCGVYPIVGIRYKCGVCPIFDLCETCRAKNQHNVDHPFAKIRDSNCAPLELQVKLKLSGSQVKSQKEGKNEKVLEKKEEKSAQNLIYESENERILLVVSILENMFGSEHQAEYFEFAKITHEKSQDKVCQSFLNWLSTKRQNTGINKLFSWFKDSAAKAQNRVSNFLFLNSD